jgi:pimeloyl-ACP methyl ester carboxylesterase
MQRAQVRDRTGKMKATRHIFLGMMVLIFLFLSGCATPVGVRYLKPQKAYQKLTDSVLSSDTLSAPTRQILNRSGQAVQFKSEPDRVIAAIHDGLPTVKETDRLFALAELSFLHASNGGSTPYFLSAAIYAYAYLFPKDAASTPDPFDPRFRLAVELYNQGIAKGLKEVAGRDIVLREGTYKTSFGDLAVMIDPNEFRWGSFRLLSFVDAAELEVRGLRNWYRWPGMGAPLVASLERLPGVEDSAFARIPAGIKVPVTVFLKPDNVEEGLKTGHITATLELKTTQEETSMTIDGRRVPIEFGLSSALAYTLEGSQIYRIELKGLLSGNLSLVQESSRFKDNVFLMAPYRPGLIPLVLIHGTASSPARWAELINEIQNDRELWGRYQFWLFTYNTGNPILYTGGILAEGLRTAVKDLDPEGKDPAMEKMVVIGHSQGGLLTKLTVVDSGTQFWENTASTPFDQLDVSSETKLLLRRSLFYKPLPFVKRVVFISTPHKGSYVSGGWIGGLTGKLISLPSTLLSPFTEVLKSTSMTNLKNIPKSTDNMAPESPFVKAISSMQVASGITAHSIIPVKNPDDPKEEWKDGVVEYKSAHIDGVESELIVLHEGHSVQDKPQAIEEIRRILIENLKEP